MFRRRNLWASPWRNDGDNIFQLGLISNALDMKRECVRRGECSVKTILAKIEREVTPGTVIPKPQGRADFIVKAWGVRRGERALIYTIPNHKTPTKPYQKGITVSEWLQAFEHLTDAGDFSRSWFERSMPACAKEGGCNFTTIGGIFELLGHAAYDRGTYRSTRSS